MLWSPLGGYVNAAGGQAEIIAAVLAVYTVVHGLVHYGHGKVTAAAIGPVVIVLLLPTAALAQAPDMDRGGVLVDYAIGHAQPQDGRVRFEADVRLGLRLCSWLATCSMAVLASGRGCSTTSGRSQSTAIRFSATGRRAGRGYRVEAEARRRRGGADQGRADSAHRRGVHSAPGRHDAGLHGWGRLEILMPQPDDALVRILPSAGGPAGGVRAGCSARAADGRLATGGGGEVCRSAQAT